MKKPLVSVIMITYGHEKFIRRAIEGVLMQECDFEIELFISNDCSPDDTDSIINEILNTDPKANLIRYYKHPMNIGMVENFIFSIKNVSGQYLAICEGDDFWIDTNKLKKQVNIFKENSDCIISYHNCEKLTEKNDNFGLVYGLDYNKKLSILDLFKGDFTKTCTVVFKNSNSLNYGQILDDTTLAMELLKNGGFAYYLPDIMSVYRIHSGGIWSQKNSLFRFNMSFEIERKINSFYSEKFPNEIANRSCEFLKNESLNLSREGFWTVAFKCYFIYLTKGKLTLSKFRVAASLLKNLMNSYINPSFHWSQ